MLDTSQFHAYTDGTDTIIGTSLEEAVCAYLLENTDASGTGPWAQLDDSASKTIRCEDCEPEKMTKTIREWIDWHLSSSNQSEFRRLLCSTEY